jgi:hypothetical protein
MDANLEANVIVVAGYTYDSGLAGVTLNGGSAIFISSFSINSTSINWRKVDTSKSLMIPHSLSLSRDAKFAVVLING